MSPSSRLLAVAALAVLAAWLAWRGLHAAAPEAVLPRPSAPAVAGVRHGPIPAAAGAAVSAPLPAASVAARVDDPACVFKRPPPPSLEGADGAAEPAPASQAGAARVPGRALRASLLARMRASADPYANAVAVWLDVGDDEEHRAERVLQLAAMASSTRDPRVYALALGTCWKRAGPGCDSLSARRWSELEPGNALAWLLLLDEARERGDVSGEQEAMFHVTQSRQLAMRLQAPLQPIVDAAADDPEALAAARSLALDAIGMVAAQAWPQSVMACRGATPADANTWQQCGAMIDLMEHRSDSLLARALGATLDKRLTGNARPLDLLRVQRERLEGVDVLSTTSCTDLRAKLALMRRMAVEGEVAVAVDLAR